MADSSRTRVRTILLAAIGALLVCIVGILVLRSKRANAPPVATVTRTAAKPRADEGDNALERAERAVAVAAIESGDYRRAVDELTKILKSGKGIGDEVELLGIAKELLDKADQRERDRGTTPPAAAAATAPSEPKPAAATPPPPARRPVVRPSTPAPAAKRPVVVAKATPATTHEDDDGQLLVFSVPVGLSVEVDGNEVGVTPVRRLVPAGRHLVVVLKGNTHLADRTVTVNADEVSTVDFDVREKLMPKEPVVAPPPEAKPPVVVKAPVESPTVATPATSPPQAAVSRAPESPASGQTGEVFVSTASLGGVVFINGTSYGPPPLLARAVPVGNALVELKSNGETRRSKEVTVRIDQLAEVKFR